MNNFYFYIPTKVYFGKNQVEKLPGCIREFGNRVLLVYGKDSIKKNGIYNDVVSQLKKSDIFFIELSGVDPNPRISTVREGARVCKENNIQIVLGVGGGSVIDCSKAIAAASKYDGDPWDIWAKKAEPKKALPVGAVITLAATASEMNKNSVISNPDTEEKKGFGHDMLIPKFAIMDPAYTVTVPKRPTAAGIADIMSHVFEYYFIEVPGATLQDEFCEGVLRTVIKYGKQAIDEPANYEARANLLWAGSMALNGVSSRGKLFDGLLHSLEHALSALYDISHGEGLALIIPYWMDAALSEKTMHRFARYARNIWNIQEPDDMTAAKRGIEQTSKFYKQLGLPQKLSDLGIPFDRFEDIAAKSMRGDTTGNLIVFTKADVVKFLERMK
ncbi:MAG: iron-containing alcohol dehydrogenase [Spirochaetales bacterium]|nr:iron-containing alcohol dehydrogenase [Spirochaetales bacterium]